MKKITNLKGVKALSSMEQKTVFGGTDPIDGESGGGNGNGDGSICFCLIDPFNQVSLVPCNSICPDGTDPFST